jgi:hypothetical protein
MRIYRHLTANDVRMEPFPFKRELAMEAYLLENEKVLALDDDIFSDVEIVESELTLKEGRQSCGTHGRIDVLATYSQEYIAVIELKIGDLDCKALKQLEDYLCERQQLLLKYPKLVASEVNQTPKWIGVLVGRTISSELAEKLKRGYIVLGDIPVGALTIQRFRGSDGSIFVTTDSYFCVPNGKRDMAKYRFAGNEFGKGRLVLAVLKQHTEQRPGLTLAELRQNFPKSCQGAMEVVTSLQSANELLAEKGRARHFLKPEELIRVEGGDVAVCNQWGTGNIDRFIEKALTLGHQIKAVG